MQTAPSLAERKNTEREIDKYVGDLYRKDPGAIGISYTEYKKAWKESQIKKQMKTRYTLYEPLPNESPIDFKKRMKTTILPVPIETIKEFEERIARTFQ